MNAYNLNLAVAVAANAIACQLNDDELTVWATVFTVLGDMLGGIAAIRELGGDDEPERCCQRSSGEAEKACKEG